MGPLRSPESSDCSLLPRRSGRRTWPHGAQGAGQSRHSPLHQPSRARDRGLVQQAFTYSPRGCSRWHPSLVHCGGAHGRNPVPVRGLVLQSRSPRIDLTRGCFVEVRGSVSVPAWRYPNILVHVTFQLVATGPVLVGPGTFWPALRGGGLVSWGPLPRCVLVFGEARSAPADLNFVPASPSTRGRKCLHHLTV